MASELRVNTLKDASGNNSVAMSTVAEGSAKAWLNADHTSNSISSSFNYSSFTDINLGDSTLAFTSSMSGASTAYSLNGMATNNIASTETWSRFYNITASGYSVRRGYETTTEFDWSSCMDQVHGDLA